MPDAGLAAVIAAAVSLLVSGASAFSARRLQDAKARTDAEAARLQQEAALHQQETRLRTELRTEFMAEEAIRALLTHEDWTLRSFGAIKRHVRGFDDNELRRLLVRAGAIAVERRNTAEELWGLRENNLNELKIARQRRPLAEE